MTPHDITRMGYRAESLRARYSVYRLKRTLRPHDSRLRAEMAKARRTDRH